MSFDLPAAAISLISLVVSIVAIRIARRAPLQQRTREIRDTVRKRLEEALVELTEARHRLRGEKEIQPFPDAIATARRAVANNAARLPEKKLLIEIGASIARLTRVWEDVKKNQVRRSAGTVIVFGDHDVPRSETSSEAKARRQEVERERAALRIELGSVIESVREEVLEYLAQLDAADSAGTDPKFRRR